MTAPAVAAPPAPPAAPVAPKSAHDLARLPEAEFMKTFGLEALSPAPETPPAEAARKKKEAAPVEAPPAEPAPETPAEVPAETPPAEEPPAEVPTDAPADAPPAETPETPAAPSETPTLARAPLMEFKVFDPSGELEIPDLQIEYKANGKDRKDSLDKVVKLASIGVYNEEREQQIIQTKAQAQEQERVNASLKQYVESVQRDLVALLSDPSDALYQQLKAQHAAQHTPEARAQRAEAALRATQTQAQQAQEYQQAQSFSAPLQQHLVELSTKHPEVSFDEIVGRFTILTAPLMQQGRVPPHQFPQVADLVVRELTPWVQHTHESRVASKGQQQQVQQAKVKAQTQVAQARAVLAKRQLARALPGTAGTTPTALREVPKPPQYKKATDILTDVTRLVSTAGG